MLILKRFDRNTGLWIFLLALTARCLHLLAIAGSDYFRLIVGDGVYFDQAARNLASGLLAGQPLTVTLSPVYLGFLSSLYSIFGHSPVIPKLAQVVLGSVSCLLLYHTAKEWWGKKAGVWAGVIGALYGVFIFYDAEIRKAALMNFLIIASFYGWALSVRKPSWWIWMLTSIAFASAALMRMNLLVALPFVCLWILLVHFPEKRWRSLAFVIIFCAGFASTAALWNVWFQKAVPQYQAPRSETGLHLFLGNNPKARGRYPKLDFMRDNPEGHSIDAKVFAEQQTGRTLSYKEADRFWTQRAFNYILEQPAAWLKLEFKKFFLIFNAYELPHDDNYPFARTQSWFLSLPLFSFALISPLGLLGLLFWFQNKSVKTLLLLFFLISYAATLLLMYVTISYRLPVQIPLIFFSAFAAVRIQEMLINKDRAGLKWASIAFLAFYLFTNYETFLEKHHLEFFGQFRMHQVLQQEKYRTQVADVFEGTPRPPAPLEEAMMLPLKRQLAEIERRTELQKASWEQAYLDQKRRFERAKTQMDQFEAEQAD